MSASEAHMRATAKYEKKAYDNIRLRVLKGTRDLLQKYCKDNNTSVNGLINELIYNHLTENGYDYIKKDKTE